MPARHGTHADGSGVEAAGPKVPATQGVGDALPAPHQLPAGQGRHVALELAPSAALKLPAGHAMQAARPGVSE